MKTSEFGLCGAHLPLHEKAPETLISVRGLLNRFGDQTIHENLDLDIRSGEILGIVGGSGTGKTVLLNTIIGLHTPQGGEIRLMGRDITPRPGHVRREGTPLWGVLFQGGALFSGLTVLENITTPLLEHTRLSPYLVQKLAFLKMQMVGLPRNAAGKLPSELSGGMVKRTALARALAIEPPVVFLDEPTSGLDPVAADEFDELILFLKEQLQLTIVMISHDLDSLKHTCDRVAVLVDRQLMTDTPLALTHHPHPWIARFFGSRRAHCNAAVEEAGH